MSDLKPTPVSAQSLRCSSLGTVSGTTPCSQPDMITAPASSKVQSPKALSRSTRTEVSVSSEKIVSRCSAGMGFLKSNEDPNFNAF